MSLSIITAWLDCPELADNYWAAMQDRHIAEVVVVDNGSDPALDFADERCTLLRSDTNLGFARASNWGLRMALSDKILFLNNDVQPLAANWTQPILDALQPGRLVGANLVTSEWTRVDGRLFPYLDGWCLAGMKDDLLDLGGWDESLAEPSYYGDNLLSLRARRAGMRLVQVDVPLRHLGNHTARKDQGAVEAASVVNRAVFERSCREVMGVA